MGAIVGERDVGDALKLGEFVSAIVGPADGNAVGVFVGSEVVGATDGPGAAVGAAVDGAAVGVATTLGRMIPLPT